MRAGAVLAALLVILAGGPGATSARGQVDPATQDTDGVVVDESGTTEGGGSEQTTTDAQSTETPTESPVDATTPESEAATRDEAREMFRNADATAQSPAAKVAERNQACQGTTRLPPSEFLGLGRSVVRTRSGSTVVIVLGIAAIVVAVAVILWRFRGRWRGHEERGLLGDVGTAIAIVAGIVGLAVQFVPGLGVRERPPPRAAVDVEQVHARVPHETYARTLGLEQRKREIDRKELGNVIWVEIGLEGYKDTELALQWGEYNLDTGGALLPGSDGRRRVMVRSDDETQFVPVWVGYPRTGRFQVQLRLLKDTAVRAMARTGEMRGTRYRFAC